MKMTKTISWALAFSILAASTSVFADRGDRRGGRDRHDDRGRPVWRGDMRHFHERDFDRWRGGHWVHTHHDDHFGWWWVVPAMGLWYWYSQPVYPYPNPYTPPLVVAPTVPSAPPQVQYWYYCDASQTYYPYVQACPGGWRMVPATPSGVPGQ